MKQQQQDQQQILTFEQLEKFYSELEKKCQMIEDFEDPGISNEALIEKFALAQKYITDNAMFSENEKLKEIQTENLRFLTLPYFIGFLYGRISAPRKEALEQSKNYLMAYLNLLETFHSEDEALFPANVLKTWHHIKEKQQFNYPREQVIANHKEKKLIEEKYKNKQKIKDEGDQRESIKQFLMLNIYEAVSQLKNISEEFKILQYKATLEKDPEEKRKHEEEKSKPIPKMKVWEIKKPEEIHSCMCSNSLGMAEKKQDKIAQVWQENANKPTMTLEQVAQLEMDNMHQRNEREKKQREENKKDSDSDKEEVDDRKKKEARAWDDWKDEHEKGAGNKGTR